MKRQQRLCITLIVIALFLIVGCIVYFASDNHESTNEYDVNTASVSGTNQLSTINEVSSGDKEETNEEKTIQIELEEVEAEYTKLNNTDTSNMSQFEINDLASERYTLWDNELNSIWERLAEMLSGDEKDELVKEQKEWITKKERNSEVAGIENGGGSAAPCLMDDEAASITRVRVYYLAEKLANLLNEPFEISSDIQAELDKQDYSLDDVLEEFEGQWIFDIDRGACIGIERSSESAYGQEDSEWTIWITGGDLYTEKDVYGYIYGCVVFHKEDDSASGYTVIDKWDNSVSSWYAGSINELLNAGGLDESIVGY
ncbi:lysozyme inhibitor LprI family protein [Pseudobutyrivibrio ruminis]|uniref:Uncharacterized conserved protein YecT, DUF1311 family n=1 Tax=Pseudobutyrivibrio ruminis DSM 9787 TaxID=1123011 RepID=A0A285SQH4_9FIRM|nr:lysozyme inhibitor LprI family protein [Pseudobutyrivibrio ruminis]SOC10243.1 Uncharacterized conserved protein YecT, DUF1311 family [Pseudobutyrivibrio ruminis DSM 9787]